MAAESERTREADVSFGIWMMVKLRDCRSIAPSGSALFYCASYFCRVLVAVDIAFLVLVLVAAIKSTQRIQHTRAFRDIFPAFGVKL